MSTQAVLSMMTPARLAAPRGSSGADASGFGDLVATALAQGETAPDAESDKAEATTEAASGDADEWNEQVPATAGPADLLTLQASPSVSAEPATGTKVAKQALSGPGSKGVEPFVLPGMTSIKATEPQVLPGVAAGEGAGPPVLPAAPSTKGAEPQVLPGVGVAKQAQPQVLPQEQIVDISLPTRPEGNQIETAPDGDPASAPAPARPDTAAPPPPLRALAERTSKPLDPAAGQDAAIAPGDKAAAQPAATATPSGDVRSGDAPPRAAEAAAPIAAASADPGSAPDQIASRADSGGVQTDTGPAPTRDHALSTLSRATVDATAQIAAQILRKLEGRSTRFEIALRPDELGRVDVKLDIDSEGRLAARLAFDNPAAATDLRGRADELRRQLEAAGFQLADDAFEFAERDSGSGAFDRGQDTRHGPSRAFAAAARLNNEIDAGQPPRWLAVSLSPSGVDMKV